MKNHPHLPLLPSLGNETTEKWPSFQCASSDKMTASKSPARSWKNAGVAGGVYDFLVGDFNPLEKYESKWQSSPKWGENKKYLKPPPSFEPSSISRNQRHGTNPNYLFKQTHQHRMSYMARGHPEVGCAPCGFCRAKLSILYTLVVIVSHT